MSREMRVVLPHDLGAQEATRRISTGLDNLRQTYASKLSAADVTWNANHADLRVGAMGQMVDGSLDIGEKEVVIVLRLPWMLAALADRIAAFVQKSGSDTLKLPPSRGDGTLKA